MKDIKYVVIRSEIKKGYEKDYAQVKFDGDFVNSFPNGLEGLVESIKNMKAVKNIKTLLVYYTDGTFECNGRLIK